MFVRRVGTVVSLSQLDDDGASAPSPDAPVAQCTHSHLPKISFAFQEGRHCQRVRSFGELRDLEDWENGR